MNSKTYSILYCVLLASTFVHEIRGKTAPDFNPHQIDKREAIPSKDELNVVISANLSIIVNVTAGTAICVDVGAHLVAVVIVKIGVVIVINLEKNILIYIKAGLFIDANVDIATLIKKLENGLGVLLKVAGGITQSPVSIKIDVLKILIGILSTFLNIGIDLTLHLELGLQILIAICGELLDVLKSIPYLLIKTIISLKTDLFGLINILSGLEEIADCLTVKDGTNPNLLKVIDDSPTGLEAIGDIISGTGNLTVNITCLENTLNDLEKFVDIATKYQANDDKVFGGLCKVYVIIVKFINGSASLADVINHLLSFLYLVKTLGPSTQIGVTLHKALVILLKDINAANASQELSDLVGYINDELSGTLIYGGVNLSAIFKLLVQVAAGIVTNVFQIIVQLVLLLGPIVNSTLALVICLIVLVLDILNPIAFGILKSLGIIVVGATSLLQELLDLIIGVLNGAINVVNFTLGKLYEILVSIPIVGYLVKGLVEAISIVTGGAIDLKKILNSKEPITELIKALLKLLGFKNVKGINGNATAIVNQTLIDICDLGPLLGIDLDISIAINVTL